MQALNKYPSRPRHAADTPAAPSVTSGVGGCCNVGRGGLTDRTARPRAGPARGARSGVIPAAS